MQPQRHEELHRLSVPPSADDDALLNSVQVRQLVGGVSDMAIWRWQRDERVRFPAPDVVINGRRYWYRATIRRWQAERATTPVLGVPQVRMRAA
jgi:predicted DNA-binding transcriptional regulator AlpA